MGEPGDVRAEGAELALDILVSPLYMVDPQYLRLALGDEAGAVRRCQQALEQVEGFAPALEMLRRGLLGLEPL